jgi:hypothetical protein
MKKLLIVLVFIAGFVFTGSVYAEENLLFSEDFSGNLSKWQIEGSPSPSIVYHEGNPAPSFSTNDDLNYGGWAVSNESFDYSNGLSVSVDLKPGHAAFPDQRFATFRFLQDNTLYTEGSRIKMSPYIINVTLTADDYGTTPGFTEQTPGPWISFQIRYINDNGVEKIEEALEIPLDSGSGWHNLKIEIDEYQKVAFYLDNNLLYNSINSIDLEYSGSAALGLGYRLCYHDNIIVNSVSPTNCEPATFENGILTIPVVDAGPLGTFIDVMVTIDQVISATPTAQNDPYQTLFDAE